MRSRLATKARVGFVAGFLLFVVGTGTAAYLGSRPDGSGRGSASASADVPVYFAAGAVDTGTSGPNALAQGLLGTRKVDRSALPVNAVTDPSQIVGGVASAVIPAGAIVTTDMFPAPQTRIGTVVIPPGKRALALKLEPMPGVAGFAGAGDLVDVYGISQAADATPARVQLVLQSVEVLNVNGIGLPAVQGQADGPSLVYLLAVTPADAERLIFLTEFNKVYFDLVAKGEPPVVTPGVGPAEALRGL